VVTLLVDRPPISRSDESMIGEEDVTDAIDEAMARAICAAGGIDPDALNGAAGVVWKLYLTDARAARSAHLAALERAGLVVVPREAPPPQNSDEVKP
jgi:hypothetical protein